MGKVFMSSIDTSFLTYMTKKYNKDSSKRFLTFDSYVMYVYYELCNENEKQYYETLEDDLKEYVLFQLGGENNGLQSAKKEKSR